LDGSEDEYYYDEDRWNEITLIGDYNGLPEVGPSGMATDSIID